MGSRSAENQLGLGGPGNRKPVRIDMAISPAAPLPGQGMIPMLRPEPLARAKASNDPAKLASVFASVGTERGRSYS